MLSLCIEQETVMAGRYELTDQRLLMIKDIVSPPQTMGRPRRDDHQMPNGILWVLCSGSQWRDLPERYGPWKTIYQRFRQWRDDADLRPSSDSLTSPFA